MIWFQRFFPVFMLLTPLLFVLFTKQKPIEQPLELQPGLVRRLWVVTLVLLALHCLVQGVLEYAGEGTYAVRLSFGIVLGVSGSMVLWLRFAGPALVAKNAAFAPPPAIDSPATIKPQTVRTASLVPRQLGRPISKSAWRAGWVLFAVDATLTLWAIANGAPYLLILGLGWWIGMAVFGARRSLEESEPRDRRGSQELAQAYETLRAFRCWCFYWMGLVGALSFTIVSVLVLVRPESAGLAGALLGASLGIAGALFGILASLRRVRVNELLLELEAGAQGH